jgi:hypothetical protein
VAFATMVTNVAQSQYAQGQEAWITFWYQLVNNYWTLNNYRLTPVGS